MGEGAGCRSRGWALLMGVWLMDSRDLQIVRTATSFHGHPQPQEPHQGPFWDRPWPSAAVALADRRPELWYCHSWQP